MADLNTLQASDSVKIAGANASGVETNFVNATSSGDMQVTDLVNAVGTQGSLTVGNTAIEVRVGGVNLTNRKLITVYNNSNVQIYWGRNNTVTTLTGTPIFPNQMIQFEGFSASQSVFLIAGTASNNVRITES